MMTMSIYTFWTFQLKKIDTSMLFITIQFFRSRSFICHKKIGDQSIEKEFIFPSQHLIEIFSLGSLMCLNLVTPFIFANFPISQNFLKASIKCFLWKEKAKTQQFSQPPQKRLWSLLWREVKKSAREKGENYMPQLRNWQ